MDQNQFMGLPQHNYRNRNSTFSPLLFIFTAILAAIHGALAKIYSALKIKTFILKTTSKNNSKMDIRTLLQAITHQTSLLNKHITSLNSLKLTKLLKTI